MKLASISPLTFEQRIEDEFIHGSAISPELFEAAITFVEDTGRWETHQALGLEVRTQWQTRKPHDFGILTGFQNESGDFWQFKPEKPLVDDDGKIQKYRTPKGNVASAFLPPIPDKYRRLIEEKADCQLTLLEESVGSFWSWLETHPEMPLLVTEGGKKSLSVLSLGHAAIALYGCDAGATKDDNGTHHLIPDLLRFCQPGRQINLAFDKDAKLKTVFRVDEAIAKLGRLLTAQGVIVRIVEWNPSQGKGIDDLHANCGASAVHEAISNAVPFVTWLKRRGKGFEVKPKSDRDRHIQKRLMRFLGYWEELKKDFTLSHADVVYQGYAPTFNAAMTGSILLRGWLGAGKTEATLRSLISSLTPYKNQQIVWVTGRNGLLYNTAERASRLGLSVYHYQDDPANYRELLNRGCPGIFTLCPDSLKDYHVSKAVWDKTILVIDEFSGVRRDVLEKSAIMPEFERLLSEASTLIAIDAFLSDVDRRVIEQYRPGNIKVYDQQFQKSPKRIVWLETRNKAGDISFSHDGLPYPLLEKWVREGKRFAIACDNKLQAKAIRDYLKELGCDGVLCSSETVENNQVLLPDPDRVLKEAIYFVYTPTAQSGLDCQTPFDCGLALYSSVISPIDFLQMIGRCRQCKEWFVSAPRRSLDPNCPVPSLESSRVKGWGEKLAATFTELGAEGGSKTVGWGLWQSLTGDVERAFHSEYLKCLLQHFFESVEVQEVECDRRRWQQDVQRIKVQEVRLRLGGNLENGQRLLKQQKAPSNDSEVWDIALAQEYEKYPQVWKELLKQYQSGVDVDEAIALAKLFTSRRLERLKHWVQATGDHAAADLADLQASVRNRFTSYASPRWKALQNLSLFQALKLDRLAAATGKATAHQTHYRIDSPIMSELWAEFGRSPKLQRLFPTVETISGFWAILQSCMRAFGYQSANKTIRVETPGQLHPNGKDRQGRQRYAESTSLYFCGWVPMTSSGSAFFQQNFDLIIEAIRDRRDWERRHRQTEQERSLAPPLAA